MSIEGSGSRDLPAAPLAGREASGATELAERVADLVANGAPLAAALVALADDWPQRDGRRRLGSMASKLEAGQPIERAVGALGMPALERVLRAADQGRAFSALQEFSATCSREADTRRQLWRICGYPAFLLVVLAAWSFAMVLLLGPVLQEIGADQQDNNSSTTTAALAQLSRLPAWELALLTLAPLAVPVALRLMLGRHYFRWIVESLPLIGPALRWRSLIAWGSSLRMLLVAQTPLDASLRLAGAAAANPGLARISSTLAAGTRAGKSFSSALEGESGLPPLFALLVAWGEQAQSLPAALDVAVGLWQDRLTWRLRLLKGVVPAVTLFVIAATIWFFLSAMAGPVFVCLEAFSNYFWIGSQPNSPSLIPLERLGPSVVFGLGLLIVARLLGLTQTGGKIALTILRIVGLTMVVEAATLALAILVFGAPSLIASIWVLRRASSGSSAGTLIYQQGNWWTGLAGAAFGAWNSLGLALLGLGALTAAVYYSQRAAERRAALLATLQMSLARGLPVPAMLAALSQEVPGRFGRRLRRLRDALEQGLPLEEALTRPRGLLRTGFERAVLGFGGAARPPAKALGQLDLRSGTFETRLKLRAALSSSLVVPIYLLVVMAGMAALRIYWPWITVHEFEGADLLSDPTAIDPLLVSLAFWVRAAFAMVLMIVAAAVAAYALLPSLRDSLPFGQLDSAAVLRMLAVATAAEAPFATVIEERLRHGQRRFRRRLGPVLNDLKAGARWTESLARWKIITTRRAALLAAAERAGNLTTALVDTAVVLERTAYRRIQRWSGAVAVVMIVMAAPVIVCLAADCLAPLADAIRIVGRAD